MAPKSLVAIGICLLCQPLAASAAVVNITATCFEGCANLGLTDNARVGGSISLDDSFYVQGGGSENEALTSYSFAFGNFSLTSVDVPDPEMFVIWGPEPRSVDSISFFASTSRDPGDDPGPALSFFASTQTEVQSGFASNNGIWHDSSTFEFRDEAAFDVQPIEVAPIPLPASAVMLAFGMTILAAVGWRGRRGV